MNHYVKHNVDSNYNQFLSPATIITQHARYQVYLYGLLYSLIFTEMTEIAVYKYISI